LNKEQRKRVLRFQKKISNYVLKKKVIRGTGGKITVKSERDGPFARKEEEGGHLLLERGTLFSETLPGEKRKERKLGGRRSLRPA